MTHSQSLPQSGGTYSPSFDALTRELHDAIAKGVDQGDEGQRRALAAAPPPPASPRPVDPKAGGRGELWGPATLRADTPNRTLTSPLQLLAEVAAHTHKLHEQMAQLVTAITGEIAPAPRLGHHPYESLGLLPAITNLAHDIEATNLLTSKLVQHVLGKVRP